MSGIIQYTPIGNGEFTKELLDQNFAAYTQALNSLAIQVQSIETSFDDLVLALATVSNQAAKQAPKNSSLMPFLVGAAAGVYLYSQFRVRWQVGERNGEFGQGPKREEPIKTEAERADKPTA